MSEASNHSIGDEIPFRRSTMDRRTGSLVFDKHLDEKLASPSKKSGLKAAQDRKSTSS